MFISEKHLTRLINERVAWHLSEFKARKEPLEQAPKEDLYVIITDRPSKNMPAHSFIEKQSNMVTLPWATYFSAQEPSTRHVSKPMTLLELLNKLVGDLGIEMEVTPAVAEKVTIKCKGRK